MVNLLVLKALRFLDKPVINFIRLLLKTGWTQISIPNDIYFFNTIFIFIQVQVIVESRGKVVLLFDDQISDLS